MSWKELKLSWMKLFSVEGWLKIESLIESLAFQMVGKLLEVVCLFEHLRSQNNRQTFDHRSKSKELKQSGCLRTTFSECEINSTGV